MDQGGIETYIAACRAQGVSDEAIRATLQAVGWTEELLVPYFLPVPAPAVLPVVQTTPAETVGGAILSQKLESGPDDLSHTSTQNIHHTTLLPRASRRGMRLAAAVIAGALVLSGGTIAFAEQGYLPGVSRLYRKTALPLLWKGTTATPAQGLGKMLEATAAAKITSYTATTDVLVDKIDASKPLQLTQSKLLSPLAEYLDPGRVLASCPSDTQCATTSSDLSGLLDDPSTHLPLSIEMQTSEETDASHNISGTFSIDLTQIASLFHPTQKATAQPHITAEWRALQATKQAYFRTNLLPALATENQNKWLSYTLSDEVIAAWENPQTQIKQDLNLSADDTQFLAALINEVGQDQGIVRENGQALAVYHLTINRDALTKLISNAKFAKWKTQLQAMVEDEGTPTITADIKEDPQSALLHELAVTAVYQVPKANVAVTLSFTGDLVYTTGSPIAAPASTATITQPADQYLTNLYQNVVRTIADGQMVNDSTWFGNSTIGLVIQEELRSYLQSSGF